MNRAEIFDAINTERGRQADKWHGTHAWGSGDCSSLEVPFPVKVMVLTEELGEIARAVMEDDIAGLCTELVQLAAVAVAWLEMLD